MGYSMNLIDDRTIDRVEGGDGVTWVALCGRCRVRLGHGARVSIVHPATYRAYAIARGLHVYEDDDPVIVCRRCSFDVKRFAAATGVWTQ
jgi:hypothetical protein